MTQPRTRCWLPAFLALLAALLAFGCAPSGEEADSEDTLSADFVAPEFLTEDPVAQETARARPGTVPLDEPPVAEAGDLAILRPRAMVTPTSAAFYVTVVNHGTTADRLIGASSTAATLIELHESVAESGAMRMTAHPAGFVIEPGDHVALEPGGKHGMIIEPRTSDDHPTLPIVLHFERAGDVEVEVPIMDPATLLEGGAG